MSEEPQSTPPNVPARPEPMPEPYPGHHPLALWLEGLLLSRRILLLMAGATALIAVATAIRALVPLQSAMPVSTPTATAPASDIEALQSRVDELTSRLEEVEAAVASAPPVPANTALGAELGAVWVEVGSLNDRLSAIEGVILQDPEGALELARLSMEVGTLEERQANRTDAIEAEVARIYDFNKWFMVLMLTMAGTLVAVAVSMYSAPRGEHRGAAAVSTEAGAPPGRGPSG